MPGATTDAWFANASSAYQETLVAAIRDGRAAAPADWPALAVESGVFDDEDAYEDRLHDATLAAAREAVTEREGADDRRLVHAVRAMDDCAGAANDLAGRVAEWATATGAAEGAGDDHDRAGVELARAVAASEDGDDALRSLAERVVALDDERAALRTRVEADAPAVAPNLAALAGPVLAARLIAAAGDLESLARMAAGTVQVLGAESALFAHLRGDAPSPKHGLIYTHEAIRGTRPADRGSAARALAGKLAIAARIDHYRGEREPSLATDLAERIDRIRSRAAVDEGAAADDPQEGDGR